MRYHRTNPVLIVAAATLAASCEEAPPPDRTVTVADSAGVTIVENPPIDPGTGAWRSGPEPVLDIGVMGGDDAHQLFRVLGAAKLSDGRIAVLNGGSNELRIFGPDGAHLESWGRQGEGPGEFMGAQSLIRWPGDSLGVWDGRLRRVTVFPETGPPGRDLTLSAVGTVAALQSPMLSGVLHDGSLVVWGRGQPDVDAGGGLTRPPIRVAVITPDGALVADLGDQPGEEALIRVGENVIEVIRAPVRRGYVLTTVDPEVLVGPNERAELRFWGSDGGLKRVVRLGEPPRLMTDRLREAEVQLRVDAAPEEARPGIRNLYATIPFPDTVPMLGRVLPDRSGHLWIQRYRLEQDEGPADWIVLNPSGQAVARLELPGGLEVFEIGTDYVLGRVQDELDVEHVQMWPLERAP